MKRNAYQLVFKVFGIVGLLILAGALYSWYAIRKFNSSATKVRATIIAMEPRTSTSSSSHSTSTTYAPVLRYTDAAGHTHEYASNFSSNPPSYAVGDVTDIYYDPKDPGHAMLSGWKQYFATIVLGSMGVIFSLLGWVPCFFIGARRYKLKESGQLVMADIVGVDKCKMIKINRRHPYQVRCKWRDPLTGEAHSFKSGMILQDPTAALRDRKQLAVYIDPQRPQRYYVDVAFLD